MNSERMNEYTKAVDIVCFECAFQDCDCDNCPVWKTMQILKELETALSENISLNA